MSRFPSLLKSPAAMLNAPLGNLFVARVSNCAHVGTAAPTTANNAASAHTTGREHKAHKGVTTILTSLFLFLQTELRQGEPLTSRKAYHTPASLQAAFL